MEVYARQIIRDLDRALMNAAQDFKALGRSRFFVQGGVSTLDPSGTRALRMGFRVEFQRPCPRF